MRLDMDAIEIQEFRRILQRECWKVIKKKIPWNKRINAFICPTEFVHHKFIEGGFPKEKLFIKPHFVLEDRRTTI